MFKKVLSLLLTVVVITGILGATAFAAVPQLSTEYDEVDTEIVKGHYYEDGFDVDEDITMKSDYPGNGTNAENTTVSKTSNVFSSAGSSSATIVIDADAGKDGEGALIYKNKETSTAKLTVKSDYISELAVGDCAVFSYDLKFATLADVIEAGYIRTIQLGATNGNSGGYHIGVTKQSGQSAYFYKYTLIPHVPCKSYPTSSIHNKSHSC